jgi:hypothetical protein
MTIQFRFQRLPDGRIEFLMTAPGFYLGSVDIQQFDNWVEWLNKIKNHQTNQAIYSPQLVVLPFKPTPEEEGKLNAITQSNATREDQASLSE